MSEDTNEQGQDELATLKARADLLKIQYHPSIGVEKLREKIAAALADAPDEQTAVTQAPAASAAAPAAGEETPAQKKKRLKLEANKLVRIRLTCMNPAKAEWEGEIITVGNTLVGSLTKFIPFNAEEGWHVPHIMYQQLKERQCQIFTTVKTARGVAVRKGKLIKEFAIEVLDPLTPAELEELARRQAMAKAID